MSSEQTESTTTSTLGLPISDNEHPDLSTYELICPHCKRDGLKSQCHLIVPPFKLQWEMPYSNEDGELMAGKYKWFFEFRCTNKHEFEITLKVPMIFEMDDLADPEAILR